MEENQQFYTIILRHDTSTQWSINNPVLLFGEYGVEDDTHRVKRGDGETAWNDLSYETFGLVYLVTYSNLSGEVSDNAKLQEALDTKIPYSVFNDVNYQVVSSMDIISDNGAIAKLTRISKNVNNAQTEDKSLIIFSRDNSISGYWSVNNEGVRMLNLEADYTIQNYENDHRYCQNQLCLYNNRIYRALEDFDAEREFKPSHWEIIASLVSDDIMYDNTNSGLESDNVKEAIDELKTISDGKVNKNIAGQGGTILKDVGLQYVEATGRINLVETRLSLETGNEETEQTEVNVVSETELQAFGETKIDKDIATSLVDDLSIAISNSSVPALKVVSKNTTTKDSVTSYLYFSTNGSIETRFVDSTHLQIDSSAIDALDAEQNRRLGVLESGLSSVNSNISLLQSHDITHESLLATHTSQIASHESRLDADEINITNLQRNLNSEITARENADTALSGRITTNADDILTKANKNFASSTNNGVVGKIESDTITNNELFNLKETLVSPVDGSSSSINIKIISSNNTVTATRRNDGTIDLATNLDTDVNYFITTETISTTIADETVLDLSKLTPADKQAVELQDIVTDAEGTWGRVAEIDLENGTCTVVTFAKQKQAVWGTITGSIEDQQDLQSALSGLDDSKVAKTNSANKVYGTDNNGNQTTYNKTDFGKVDTVNNISADSNKNITIVASNIDWDDTTYDTGNSTIQEMLEYLCGNFSSLNNRVVQMIRNYAENVYVDASITKFLTYERNDGVLLMAKPKRNFVTCDTEPSIYECFQADVANGHLVLVGIPEQVGPIEPVQLTTLTLNVYDNESVPYTDLASDASISISSVTTSVSYNYDIVNDYQIVVNNIPEDDDYEINISTQSGLVSNSVITVSGETEQSIYLHYPMDSYTVYVVNDDTGDPINLSGISNWQTSFTEADSGVTYYSHNYGVPNEIYYQLPNNTGTFGTLEIDIEGYEIYSDNIDLSNSPIVSMTPVPEPVWDLEYSYSIESVSSIDGAHPEVYIYSNENASGPICGIEVNNNSDEQDLLVSGSIITSDLSPSTSSGIIATYNYQPSDLQDEQSILNYETFSFYTDYIISLYDSETGDPIDLDNAMWSSSYTDENSGSVIDPISGSYNEIVYRLNNEIGTVGALDISVDGYDTYSDTVDISSISNISMNPSQSPSYPDWVEYANVSIDSVQSSDNFHPAVIVYQDNNNIYNVGFKYVNTSLVDNLEISGIDSYDMSSDSETSILGYNLANDYSYYDTESAILEVLAFTFVSEPPSQHYIVGVYDNDTGDVIDLENLLQSATFISDDSGTTYNGYWDGLSSIEFNIPISESTYGQLTVNVLGYDIYSASEDISSLSIYMIPSSGPTQEEEETYEVLNEVLGTSDEFEGVGGTDAEVEEVLDEILGTEEREE